MPKNTSDFDIQIYDGEKSVRLQDLPPEAWRTIVGDDIGADSVKKLYSSVPWLFRGVDIRSNAVAKVPFSITKGETIIDDSMNYQNKVGWWPRPQETLALIEASLTLMGRAYLIKDFNRMTFLKRLRYVVPTTIRPKINAQEGLTSFERRLGGQVIPLALEDVAWFWDVDAFTEIGPPDTSPAKTAIRAAGVLFNVDTFVESFFKRGAIKAMIIAVPKGTPKDQRDKIKSWFGRLISGAINAWSTNVVADKITTVTIGEGIQELSNTDLTKEKREDIAVALGVPQNILFSADANFATAKQEDFRLYDLTIESEIKLIEASLNELVFGPESMAIKFHQQALQVFQQEEVARSGALVNLERANIPPWDGMRILGYDLPPEVTMEQIRAAIEDYMEFKSGLSIPAASNSDLGPNMPSNSSAGRTAQSIALDTYKSHAIKRFKAGKSIKGTKDAPKFDSEDIPNTLKAAVAGALNRVKDIKDINRIFEDAKKSEQMHHVDWSDYP